MLYNKLMKSKPGILGLVDPDRPPKFEKLKEAFNSLSAILVGTSYLKNLDLESFIGKIKSVTDVPIIMFPGGANQVASNADGILFLSLLSGRNPQYLIGDHVRAVFSIREANLEVIPTGYLLIEGGNYTSVEYISNTKPIPRNKPEIAQAHALAAQYLGMRFVYLEAGSGAKLPVPVEMVSAVRSVIDAPLIVGGGLRKYEDVIARFEAGCDFVVIGTLIETDPHLFKRIVLELKEKR